MPPLPTYALVFLMCLLGLIGFIAGYIEEY